jgi:hypothetical protein
VELAEAAAEGRAAGEERTARRKARQLKAAQARLGRSGRRKKISWRRSSVRALMVVGAGGGGGEGGSGEAMAVKARTAAVRCGCVAPIQPAAQKAGPSRSCAAACRGHYGLASLATSNSLLRYKKNLSDQPISVKL